ncbi:MAG: hypothetical protein EOO53_22460 [Gammaproteobacteria bacterium]|nr:MAG: hypothetical protein EOO53_22460 [Gammaproteobacteria bacterium]
MADERNTPTGAERDRTTNRLESQSSVPGDLPDSPEDRERLSTEETFIDLPDVKDIPGQEFVNVPSIGEMADTTPASDDEEGVGVFDLDDTEDFTEGTEGDVRPDEREALRDTTYMPTRDEDRLRRASMDNVDFEGEPLNEEGFGEGNMLSGADLDIDTAGDETRTDAMGQGDEENKLYSEGDTDTDQPNENRTGA